MIRAGEEEDRDENERFHDSLDRLLSSSNTSCSGSPSNSDREDDEYGVWISQPSSVEERRVRLLCRMGLTGDPSLLLRRPALSLSLSSPNHLNPPDEDFHKTNITTSKSLDSSSKYVNDCDDSSNCNGIAFGIVGSKSDGDSVSRKIQLKLTGGTGANVDNDNGSSIQRNFCTERSSSSSRSPASTASPNKPPKVKTKIEGSNHNRSFSSAHPPLTKEEEQGGSLECYGPNDVTGSCVIKNLDNGKEFMVNEMKEDGTWKKIREVGTGGQTTMEEFTSEMCVGTSPIVQELMRRQNFEDGNRESLDLTVDGVVSKSKKRGSWLKSIKNVAISVTGHKERRSCDEKDTSSEKGGGRRSSSATDDSQDVFFHGPEKVRVRHYGKSVKELTALYKSQEIQAHKGSVWSIQFSLDGKYLASAGEDRVIHVWQVVETERKEDFFSDKIEDGNFNHLFLGNGSPELSSISPNPDGRLEKKRRGRSSISRKSVTLEQISVPETVFGLSDKPLFSFHGHLEDVLDLSWSKSQVDDNVTIEMITTTRLLKVDDNVTIEIITPTRLSNQLLSSSMDKTVRLWDLSSKSCLKIFSHSDYVTCIHFNPVDDSYFISGSLDAKVRIWSIPDHQVVDWNDLREMVTAACYTPDGQGALVGTYKGSCCMYNTSENKLLQKIHINLQNKKKKSHQKKITGFQFAPGSTSEVLVTSADSRIRVLDGVDLVHKFKGFHNTNSQISASLTSNGKYAISASEDSYVYMWRHEADSRPNRTKGVMVTQSYEFFHCQDVSVAIPWPSPAEKWAPQYSPAGGQNGNYHRFEDVYNEYHPTTPVGETYCGEGPHLESACTNNTLNGHLSSATNGLFDKVSVTWPEEKLLLATAKNRSPNVSVDFSNGFYPDRSAWGMVIVTAGLKGQIKIFQNFGLPVRI